MFKGHIESCHIHVADLLAWQRHVKRLDNEAIQLWMGKAISQSQRGYYRAVILPRMAKHFGYAKPRDMHELLKKEFLVGPNGEVGSTKLLDSAGFSEFIENALQLAAENDCHIPEPEPKKERG